MDSLFNAACADSSGACDTLGVWLGAMLTLLVLSYLVKDSVLFRLASSLLVGAAIGYGSAVILRTVLWDGLLAPLLSDTLNLWVNYWPMFIPLVLGLLLLTKLVPQWNLVGNVSLGYLFGVGAALAIGGALAGILVPQLRASALSLSPLRDVPPFQDVPPPLGIESAFNPAGMFRNLLIVVGTVGALLAFRFTTGWRGGPLRGLSALGLAWGRLGRVFILVAFGAIFASVLTARVSTLVGQLHFLLHDWLGLIK